MTATVTSLPFCKHTGGGGATPAFSGWLVYLQIAWEVPLPQSPVEPSSWQSLLQAFLLQGCWAEAATPAFSSQFVYLQFCEGLPLPHSSELRAPCLLCYVSFCCCLFSFFPEWGGQFVQGAMLIWPRVVYGSTACHLAHLVVCFSRAGRSWHLVMWEPAWFLCLMWSGEAMRWLGVWWCRSFASSWWFFLQGVSPAFLQDFTLRSMLSASFL
jgi:hypothetical protein